MAAARLQLVIIVKLRMSHANRMPSKQAICAAVRDAIRSMSQSDRCQDGRQSYLVPRTRVAYQLPARAQLRGVVSSMAGHGA